MADDDSIAVRLDPMLGDKKELDKWVDEVFLPKTYMQLVKYMLDPEPDSKNEGYNAAQRESTQIIKDWFEEAKQNPKEYTVNLTLITNDTPPQEIQVDLDEIVSKHNDRALITLTREEDGKEYRAMNMRIVQGTGGGYINPKM